MTNLRRLTTTGGVQLNLCSLPPSLLSLKSTLDLPPAHLAPLSNLVKLTIFENHNSLSLPALPKLERFKSDEAPRQLDKLPKLKCLDLSHTRIECFDSLVSLQRLKCGGISKEISMLTNLKELVLRSHWHRGEGEVLAHFLPKSLTAMKVRTSQGLTAALFLMLPNLRVLKDD
jgi:hypothetical protein